MRFLLRKRPLIGALLLVALLLPPFASADAQENTDPPELALRKGAWALQFSLASGLSLTALSGAFFFGKYHLSPRSALRLGLGFGARFGETDSESTRLEGTDEIMGTSESEDDYTSYAISMEYLFYPSPRPGVNLFLGVGPTFSIWDGSSSSTREGVYPDGPYVSQATEARDGWSLGLAGVLGGEWFATRSFSVTGQYGLNANYAKATDTRTRLLERTDPADTDYSRTVYETNSFQVSGARVLLGLSMYF